MKQQHLIYLILGIAATALFVLFGEWCYELHYVNGFSDDMHNYELNTTVSVITALVPWVAAGIYYYAINSVRFDRWYHWLVVLALVMLVTPVAGYMVTDSVMADNGKSYVAESVTFELLNMLWAAVLFVVASFSMRWWSSNCRHTPIPQ